jgi:hypothetical protein
MNDEAIDDDGEEYETPATKNPIHYTVTQRGRTMLVYMGYKYVENRHSRKHIFWRCSRYTKYRCRATLVTSKHRPLIGCRNHSHSHDEEKLKVSEKLFLVTDTVALNELLLSKEAKPSKVLESFEK